MYLRWKKLMFHFYSIQFDVDPTQWKEKYSSESNLWPLNILLEWWMRIVIWHVTAALTFWGTRVCGGLNNFFQLRSNNALETPSRSDFQGGPKIKRWQLKNSLKDSGKKVMKKFLRLKAKFIQKSLKLI